MLKKKKKKKKKKGTAEAILHETFAPTSRRK